MGASLRKPLLRALKAAEVEQRFTPCQGFRRTFNNLLRQVTSEVVTRSMIGHVTERMTEHYSHVEQDEKQEAVASVLQLVQAQSGTLGGPFGSTLDRRKEER